MTKDYVRKAASWLIDFQNKDGGWGETCKSYWDTSLSATGRSTASQTSWAVLGLLCTEERSSDAVSKGIEYIAINQLETTLLQAAAPFYLVFGCLAFGFLIGAISGTLPALQASKTNVPTVATTVSPISAPFSTVNGFFSIARKRADMDGYLSLKYALKAEGPNLS